MRRAERIGVTGHRWTRLNRDAAKDLEFGLAALLAEAAPLDGRAETLVCGMAEGADLIAASCRPEGWGLEAALPLPEPAWRAHLAAQPGVTFAELALYDRLLRGAVVTVLPHGPAQPGFEALAEHLVETCDALVAVWDGEAGRPGGTGDVVARARARGLRVLHLDARPFMRA